MFRLLSQAYDCGVMRATRGEDYYSRYDFSA